MKVEGFGFVKFPLAPRDAKKLIGLCERAPFGRGEETVVDVTVRNTWQLGKLFLLTNYNQATKQQTILPY